MLRFLGENPGVRFSLVHFDCDLYRPTKAALAAIWPRVARGGVLIFDEYAIPAWGGRERRGRRIFRGGAGGPAENLRLDQRARRVSGQALSDVVP
jgi:hypothetical protein